MYMCISNRPKMKIGIHVLVWAQISQNPREPDLPGFLTEGGKIERNSTDNAVRPAWWPWDTSGRLRVLPDDCITVLRSPHRGRNALNPGCPKLFFRSFVKRTFGHQNRSE